MELLIPYHSHFTMILKKNYFQNQEHQDLSPIVIAISIDIGVENRNFYKSRSTNQLLVSLQRARMLSMSRKARCYVNGHVISPVISLIIGHVIHHIIG